MASSVFYKWASRKDESSVKFDGTGISVFDLKKEIILTNNMSKAANDFDLVIFDKGSNQGSIFPFSIYLTYDAGKNRSICLALKLEKYLICIPCHNSHMI